jgi:hypothetical protein
LSPAKSRVRARLGNKRRKALAAQTQISSDTFRYSEGDTSVSATILAQYTDRSRAVPELRDAARNLILPEVYAKSYGDLLLDRPVFAAETEIGLFGDDLVEVFGILAAIPGLLFGGDLRAYGEALGMDSRLAGLIARGATGKPPVHGRADAYHDGTAFRLLEFNIGSELGGTDTAQLNRAFLGLPAFAEFALEHDLGYMDTTEHVAAELRAAAARVTGASQPTVALLESTGGLASHEHVFLALREAMARHGLDLMLGEIHEIGERNGKITLHGVPVDVVLRYFVAGELAGTSQEQMLDLLIQADKAGRTALYLPLEGGMLASKGSLALLHDPRLRKLVTRQQREVIDRVVPWTRLLGEGLRRGGAERDHLLDYCRDQRADLVIKPGVGYGAVGTVLGRDTTPGQWDDVLAACADGDHVIQRLVTPVPEKVLSADTGVVEDWRANWGIFIDEAGYRGAFVRALKPADGSIISYSNPGTRGACVFTYPQAP